MDLTGYVEANKCNCVGDIRYECVNGEIEESFSGWIETNSGLGIALERQSGGFCGICRKCGALLAIVHGKGMVQDGEYWQLVAFEVAACLQDSTEEKAWKAIESASTTVLDYLEHRID